MNNDNITCNRSVTIILDSRETMLKSLFSDMKCSYIVQQLPVADIVFQTTYECECDPTIHSKQKNSLLIERKTFSDFYSSILSGRFAEQRNRLKDTGSKVTYIIEDYRESFSPIMAQSKRGSKDNAHTAVNGAIENLVLYHDIFVIPTFSTKHTAKTLANIQKKLTDKDISSISSSLKPNDVLMTKSVKTMENMFSHQLMLIPGVSQKVAQVIQKTYPTVRSLIDAYLNLDDEKNRKTLLANISSGKKRIGNVISERIHNVYMVA